MSVLFLSSDPAALLGRLGEELNGPNGDFFTPQVVVVPNSAVGNWLKLSLARAHGIAMNVKRQYLETALWEMLREVDPRAHPHPPEMLDGDRYRLLVLSVLLGEKSPAIRPLRDFLGKPGTELTRRSCRRAWHLADRLGSLIREYEYHRQEALMQNWIRDLLRQPGARPATGSSEISQRFLFQEIIREPSGRRALLNHSANRNFKTLPQYAMEVMELTRPDKGTRRSLHVFGVTGVSALHLDTLRWLGDYFDLTVYHLNPLIGHLEGINHDELKAFAGKFRHDEKGSPTQKSLASITPGEQGASVTGSKSEMPHVLQTWGRASAESLSLMADLLAPGSSFRAEVIAPIEKPTVKGPRRSTPKETVLHRLQSRLLFPTDGKAKPLAQDQSLQIVGCPGIRREVETVYNSILHNLHRDPTLKQTDIMVLVTDMNRYRPELQAVFERGSSLLRFNVGDYSAAGLSLFGGALLGMLDLALESFTRTRVLEVLFNPCILARLGVSASQARTWLAWAESLGIFQGWDGKESGADGKSSSPLYSWRLGLQRLRLGHYMDAGLESSDNPAPRFGTVLPFSDIESTDREQLDAFCRAIEELLPAITRLRRLSGKGRAWADALRRLIHQFLSVPDNRPEEEHVRDQLLDGLDHLTMWESLFPDNKEAPALPLPLVREFVQGTLESISGGQGAFLTGGVTIGALNPLKPIPSRIVYVLGLGEQLFPGSNALSTLDLRGEERAPGDVRPAEHGRFLFLQTLLLAQERVYLSYDNKDLQKDQDLLPAVCMRQLERYLDSNILEGEFQEVAIPLLGHDGSLFASDNPAYQDVLTQYDTGERRLALLDALKNKSIPKSKATAVEEACRRFNRDFSLCAEPADVFVHQNVSIGELAEFLKNPTLAWLRKHLALKEESEIRVEDDEPFVTGAEEARQLSRQVIESVVRKAHDQSQGNWRDRFDALYSESRLRCKVPDAEFGQVDHDAIQEEIASRLDVLEPFLAARKGMTFCGPVLIGESTTQIGAKRRFAALTLTLRAYAPTSAPRTIRVMGTQALVWEADDRVDMLVLTSSAKSKDLPARQVIAPLLFYLTLRASEDPPARAWLKERHCSIHVAWRDALSVVEIREISGDEARAYLQTLVADFLTPHCDLLPLELLGSDKINKYFVLPEVDVADSSESFAGWLADEVAEKREDRERNYWLSDLIELSNAKVPEDALAKVRRRLGLLRAVVLGDHPCKST